MHYFYWLTSNRIAAGASAINAVVVIVLAFLNYRYLKTTRVMANAAMEQSEASKQLAISAGRTLDILLMERTETDTFQRAVFQSECRDLLGELRRLVTVVSMSAKPFRERDCFLLPQQWDICRTFISRHAPAMLAAMLALEANLQNDAVGIMGVIRAPDSQWLSLGQRRMALASQIMERLRQVERFQQDVLAAADANKLGAIHPRQ